MRGVVVDTEEVDRCGDQLHVAGVDQRRRRQHFGSGQPRVGAVQDGLEEDPVLLGVGDRRGVGGVLAGGADRMEVERDPDLPALGSTARIACIASPWPSSRWWVAAAAQPHIGLSGRMRADPVALAGRYLGLVQRDPHADLVTELAREQLRVLGEPLGGVAVGPAALVLELLREVPVVDGGQGDDVAIAQAVDQRAVEVQPALVGRGRCRSAARAARRSRTGSRRRRARSAARGPPRSGGRSHMRCRRCRRRAPCPACG